MKNNRDPRIVIAGSGPAGSSIAIRLAGAGYPVTLIERENFPRHKLCGEFISPECLRHFDDLGVSDSILSRGGERISKTVFYESGGRGITIPSDWLGASDNALGLSRAEMDLQLMRRARAVGVDVREGTSVTGVIQDGAILTALKLRGPAGDASEVSGNIFIDATGRTAILTKLIGRRSGSRDHRRKGGIIGFKSHLRGTDLEKGRCEIYSFPGGYGGLMHVEDGLANHCFLTTADVVRDLGGSADAVVSNHVLANLQAQKTMQSAAVDGEWLAVSIDRFGPADLSPAPNVFAIGDAGAFIDPFTGSGILMALESSEIFARCLLNAPDDLALSYRSAHRDRFARRMRLSSVLRRASFSPNLAKFLIFALGLAPKAAHFVARSTRPTEAGAKEL